MEFNPLAGERVGIDTVGLDPKAQVPPPRSGGTKLTHKVEEVLLGFVKGADMRSMADSSQHRVIWRHCVNGRRMNAVRHRRATPAFVLRVCNNEPLAQFRRLGSRFLVGLNRITRFQTRVRM